jgi:hypothetical protein
MMTMASSIISPRQTLLTLIGTLFALAALLVATLALPFSPYVAWQRAQGTQMFHARWIYERIRFDPTPIDVAVIGSSRLEAGISPVILSRDLSARLGRPIHVANLSIVMPGRDFSYKIVQLLLDTRPEVRLILLSDDGDVVNSHPMFPETATARELLTAPVLMNGKYATNLLALPYRNLVNMAGQVAPGWFGIAATYAPAAYAGTDLDRTRGYRLPDGGWNNGAIHKAASELLRLSNGAVDRQTAGLSLFHRLPETQRLAVDRRYVGEIGRMAQAKGVRVAFLALPLYGPRQSPGDSAFYRQIGPVLKFPGLARDPMLYQSGAHLNRQGAVRASALAAAALAPIVASAQSVPKGTRDATD